MTDGVRAQMPLGTMLAVSESLPRDHRQTQSLHSARLPPSAASFNRALRDKRSVFPWIWVFLRRAIPFLFQASKNLRSCGKVTTHCRTGTGGMTWSTRWAASSVMRLPSQELHNPLCLQENATATACLHLAHLACTKPNWSRPHC